MSSNLSFCKIPFSGLSLHAGSGTLIAFQGLQDGTLYLILRNRFEEEISSFPVDLKKDLGEKYDQMVKKIRSLRGKVNHLSGKLAEGDKNYISSNSC